MGVVVMDGIVTATTIIMSYWTVLWLASLWICRRRPRYKYWWETDRQPRRHHNERR